MKVSLAELAEEIYKTVRKRSVRRTLLEKSRHYAYHYVHEETVVLMAIWSTSRGHGPPLHKR